MVPYKGKKIVPLLMYNYDYKTERKNFYIKNYGGDVEAAKIAAEE